MPETLTVLQPCKMKHTAKTTLNWRKSWMKTLICLSNIVSRQSTFIATVVASWHPYIYGSHSRSWRQSNSKTGNIFNTFLSVWIVVSSGRKFNSNETNRSYCSLVHVTKRDCNFNLKVLWVVEEMWKFWNIFSCNTKCIVSRDNLV